MEISSAVIEMLMSGWHTLYFPLPCLIRDRLPYGQSDHLLDTLYDSDRSPAAY
jgi:hypothetical protein